jgi:hypothetical protein
MQRRNEKRDRAVVDCYRQAATKRNIGPSSSSSNSGLFAICSTVGQNSSTCVSLKPTPISRLRRRSDGTCAAPCCRAHRQNHPKLQPRSCWRLPPRNARIGPAASITGDGSAAEGPRVRRLSLEGEGFEPSVPRQRTLFETAPFELASRWVARGTAASNLHSSTAEYG